MVLCIYACSGIRNTKEKMKKKVTPCADTNEMSLVNVMERMGHSGISPPGFMILCM